MPHSRAGHVRSTWSDAVDPGECPPLAPLGVRLRTAVDFSASGRSLHATSGVDPAPGGDQRAFLAQFGFGKHRWVDEQAPFLAAAEIQGGEEEAFFKKRCPAKPDLADSPRGQTSATALLAFSRQRRSSRARRQSPPPRRSLRRRGFSVIASSTNAGRDPPGLGAVAVKQPNRHIPRSAGEQRRCPTSEARPDIPPVRSRARSSRT